MKIAIHHKEKGTFSERWIKYCEQQHLPFVIVDCYSNNIVEQVADCDAVLWHHNHVHPKDVLFARQLLFALENAGKKVFPNFYTQWHFDDKVAQKYLLEATDVPMVKSFVFYDKAAARQWIDETSFPKVFKLRGGAGSKNVMLVKNRSKAHSLVNTAFGRGFRQYDAVGGIKEQLRKLKIGKGSVKEVLKAVAHLLYPVQLEKVKGREKGYAYFQEFIPGNTFDIRVIVIGNKAFAIKRLVRENDFRASGSGFLQYVKEDIDIRCVRASFEANKKLHSQCIAYDYVFDTDGLPLIVEISYGFMAKGYDLCPGYWDEQLNWHEGAFNPYGWMIENLIKAN
jgi:glutathione synthase/RimK-type ligase-like ATP-grasp enzyme